MSTKTMIKISIGNPPAGMPCDVVALLPVSRIVVVSHVAGAVVRTVVGTVLTLVRAELEYTGVVVITTVVSTIVVIVASESFRAMRDVSFAVSRSFCFDTWSIVSLEVW
jgi:hypothetical protein